MNRLRLRALAATRPWTAAPARRSWRAAGRAGTIGATLAVVGSLGVTMAACSAAKQSGANAAKLPDGVRDETIEHQACDESVNRVETLDANNDGKSDVQIVYAGKSNVKLCLTSDLNYDGQPDLYEFYDRAGQLRRREADYDDNGTVDAIETYVNGKLTERELDTTGQHRLDTWEFYDDAGNLVRRERDTTNDGRIDQRSTFDAKHETITYDRNGDGVVDPADTVVLNLDGTEVQDEDDAGSAGNAGGTGLASGADGGTAPAVPSGPTLAEPMSDGLDAGAADAGKAKRGKAAKTNATRAAGKTGTGK